MTETSSRLDRVIAAIDAANLSDPRLVDAEGGKRPFEIVYAERMSEELAKIYPDASDLLRIAARAQHIRRFDIPRTDFPEGRSGYNDWRRACRDHHAKLTAEIMTGEDYSEAEIGHVGRLIRKEQLKKDRESQALENVVGVVFVAYYLEPFLAQHSDYSDDKLIDIIGKTLRKMSAKGHQAALGLALPERTRKLIAAAVEREAETLAKLAAVAID